MADLIYDYGLDEWRNFTSDTVKALIVTSGYTPSRAHHFVADVTPGSNELVVGSYARLTLTTKARTVDTTNHRVRYSCDDLAFGSLAAGATAAAIIVFKQVTNDADSILLALLDIADTATNGQPFTYNLGTVSGDRALHYIDQA